MALPLHLLGGSTLSVRLDINSNQDKITSVVVRRPNRLKFIGLISIVGTISLIKLMIWVDHRIDL